ncbi:MAG: PEGA domain-containing protein [Bacteroidia bacterium]|nr:PEGA domain-containing protein [Bacteroidia bacterium]
MQLIKCLCTLLLIILIGGTGRVTAQDIEPRESPFVSIESDPQGAEVYAGDSLMGRTPLRVLRSDAAHLVLYYPERAAWNAQRSALGPDPLPAHLGVMHVRFTRTLQIRSVPYGAAVYRGEEFIGYTPVDLPVDTAALSVRKPGYLSQIVRTGNAHEGALLVVLPVASGERPAGFALVDEPLRMPGMDIVLPAGATLAAGVAAVMFKQYADGRYDAYLRSRDEALLSDAKKYDIYAGLSLALMQLGLGYFILRIFGD